MPRRLALALLAAASAAIPGAAAAVTYLEQIERLGAIYGALLDHRPGSLPGPDGGARREMVAELAPVPDVDHRIGGKREPVDVFPLVGRAGLSWSPDGVWQLGAMAIPPIEVRDAKAHLWGADLLWRGRWFAVPVAARIYHTRGKVRGAFSAPEVSDEFALESTGGDLRAGHTLGAWTAYLGAGGGAHRTRFTMAEDGARINNRGDFAFGLIGVGWRDGPWTVIGEQQRTGHYLNHFQLTIRHAF